MDHLKLSDELRSMLIESAAWAKADITPTRLDEASSEVAEKTKETEETEEVVEESSEEESHACPLCSSQLSESLEEEAIIDHLNVVMGLVDRLSQMNEGDEDIENVIATAVSELLLQNETEEE